MFLKLLTAIVIILAAGALLGGRRAVLPRRTTPQRTTPQPTAPRMPRADDLVKCARCGIWLPSGQGCDCAGEA